MPGQIGEKYVDEYIKADYSDKELILKIAKEKHIEAICQCCNDYGVYTAAYVAEKLGLPGYDSYETTLLLHNKDRFKQFAAKNGIFTLNAKVFDGAKAALEWCWENVVYPVIVKPVDASAGNGISKIETPLEAKCCIKKAFEKSRVERIIIEPFITGSQHGFCTFLIDKKVAAYCSNNEYSFLNPYRVEIDTFPADISEKVKDILISQIEKMANILNLNDGIFHLQYIMDGNKPVILEVMRRVLGNMYSVPANMLTNMDWDYWEARARCGMSCACFPNEVRQEGYYAYKTLLAEENGKIESIKIPEKYQKYLVRTVLLKDVGDIIEDYKSVPIGFLFFTFSSQEEMKQILINEYKNECVIMARRI